MKISKKLLGIGVASIGALASIDVVKVTTNKGTASASTMNKLFIEVGQNKTDIYYTTDKKVVIL